MTREQHQRHREMNTIIAALRYWAANVVKDRDWMNMSLEFDYAKLHQNERKRDTKRCKSSDA